MQNQKCNNKNKPHIKSNSQKCIRILTVNLTFFPLPIFRYSFLQHNDLYYCNTLQLQIHIWGWITCCINKQMRQFLFYSSLSQDRDNGRSDTQNRVTNTGHRSEQQSQYCKFIKAFYKQHKEQELSKRIIKQYCSCLQGPFPKCERIAQEKAQKCLLVFMLLSLYRDILG